MDVKANEKQQVFDRTLEDPIAVIATSTAEPSSFADHQQYQQQQQQMESSSHHSITSDDQGRYLAAPTRTIRGRYLPTTSAPAIINEGGQGVTSEQQHTIVQPNEILCHHPSLDGLNFSATNPVNNKHKEPEKEQAVVSTGTWDTAVQSSYESAPTWYIEDRMFHDIAPTTAALQRDPSFESASSQLSFSSFDNNDNHLDTAAAITSNQSHATSTTNPDNNSNGPRSSTTISKGSTNRC